MNELDVRDGLREVRRLVGDTHWVQGKYVDVYYPRDGEYADGAVVKEGKVVGCLVGLTNLVAHDKPFTVDRYNADLPKETELSLAMKAAMLQTIAEEFAGDEFYDNDPDSEDHEGDDISVEGWNDVNSRSREQVLAMLDRAIERMSVSV